MLNIKKKYIYTVLVTLLALSMPLDAGAAWGPSSRPVKTPDNSPCITCAHPLPCGTAAPVNRTISGYGNDSPEKRESDPSKQVDQIAKLAEMTLKGVAEDTDFLADLWKATTIIGGLIIAVLSFFGIKTWRDIKKKSKKYMDDISKLQEDHHKFIKETTSNHLAMMTASRMENQIGTAVELEFRAEKIEADETEKNRLLQEARSKFESAREDGQEILRNAHPTDAGIAAWLYNLYGFSQYKLGDYSSALAAAKDSIKFKQDNATALYNAACYAAKLKLAKQSMEFLKQAIEVKAGFLDDARDDADFVGIRTSQEYRDFFGE